MIKIQERKTIKSIKLLGFALIICLICKISVSASEKIKVGTVFKQDGEKYKVTSLHPRTVEFAGVYGSDWGGVSWEEDDLDSMRVGITIGGNVTYKGKKYKITSIADKAMRGNKKITYIDIDNTIKSIGNSAFEGCPNLLEVKIGKSVKTIGEKSFYNCKKLENIYINSKKLKNVGEAAFKKIKKGGYIKCPKKYQKLIKGKLGT